jgi:hypothetical protein
MSLLQPTTPSVTDNAQQEQLHADSLLLGPDFSSAQATLSIHRPAGMALVLHHSLLPCMDPRPLIRGMLLGNIKPTPKPKSIGVRSAGPTLNFAYGASTAS